MEVDLLIYSEKRSNRLQYVIDEVFNRRLGITARNTQNKSEFVEFDGMQLNYSIEPFDLPSIYNAGLLFERRVISQDVEVKGRGRDAKIFSDTKSELGFDVFSAVFWCLSRYEEFLPHLQDEHQRFLATESWVVQHSLERYPLVDIYSMNIRKMLEGHFVNFHFPNMLSDLAYTVDVDQVFAFKAKGLARTIAGTAKSLLFSRSGLAERLSVLTGADADPLDLYSDIIDRCKEVGCVPLFFFQVGENTKFDTNNPPHLSLVKERINEVALLANIGIHPSYYSSQDEQMMKREIRRLRSVSAAPVDKSRQHFLRFKLPETFRQLEANGIKHDYSMGYTDRNGFRASTSFPFKFYDLMTDEATTLTLHPMSWMDIAAIRSNLRVEEAELELKELKAEVDRVGGTFTTTWHPESLMGMGHEYASFPLLEAMLR